MSRYGAISRGINLRELKLDQRLAKEHIRTNLRFSKRLIARPLLPHIVALQFFPTVDQQNGAYIDIRSGAHALQSCTPGFPSTVGIS